MFYVTSLDGSQVEPLINIGTDFKLEQSVDGTFTVSSSCFPGENNPGYDLLKSETVITVENNDFKVKQYRDSVYSKNITALSIFFEQSKTQRHGIFSGSHTLNNQLNFVLAGTGWTFTVDSSIANITNYITDFGNDNIVSLVNKICKYHACEYQILPNNRLHFAKEIGPDEDYQYRYKHNVSDVVLIEDSTNLYTYIKGFGADGLEVDYTSPNVSVYGFKEAPPIRDDRFKDRAALLNYIKNSLKDVPDLAIESKIPELTNRAIGERIWLIYEPLGIEIQTRILKQTKVLRNGELVTESVVFGNTLIQSSIDILVEQQEQIDETNRVIEKAKDEYRSAITQTEGRITLEVEQLNTSIARVDIKANQIQSTVSSQQSTLDAFGNRISNAESSITQTAFEITQKVSYTDYNGNEIASRINQSATAVLIEAERIDFVGQIFGQGATFSGDIQTTQNVMVGNNLELGYPGDTSYKSITFNFFSEIYSNGDSLTIHSNDISLWGDTSFSGSVDFGGAYVTGLGNIDAATLDGYTYQDFAFSDTMGLGFGYSSSSKRLYVRLWGTDQGYLTLS
ncbi:prophage endopeptidase tail family protein [Solibacillus sp. FSL K6-1781]|uniref:prophage endopeptidase tail family protein n=1 Tax=Solibacillus sp. FSL K6-1781 TaxID=2921474 RepID=UPI00315A380B